MEFDRTKVFSKPFMNYLLNSAHCLRRFREIAIGTTSVAAIYTRDLMNVQLPLPTKPEQEAIGRILSDMDVELTALEQWLWKVRMISEGLMQALLTGRIRLL